MSLRAQKRTETRVPNHTSTHPLLTHITTFSNALVLPSLNRSNGFLSPLSLSLSSPLSILESELKIGTSFCKQQCRYRTPRPPTAACRSASHSGKSAAIVRSISFRLAFLIFLRFPFVSREMLAQKMQKKKEKKNCRCIICLGREASVSLSLSLKILSCEAELSIGKSSLTILEISICIPFLFINLYLGVCLLKLSEFVEFVDLF